MGQAKLENIVRIEGEGKDKDESYTDKLKQMGLFSYFDVGNIVLQACSKSEKKIKSNGHVVTFEI